MMNMQNMGWGMVVMGIVYFALIAALVLGIAALIKYLFFTGDKGKRG